jgi:hypothetical protein
MILLIQDEARDKMNKSVERSLVQNGLKEDIVFKC